MLLSIFSFASAQEENKKEEKKQTECNTSVNAAIKDHLTHEPVQNVEGELLMAADSSFVEKLMVEEQGGNIYAKFQMKKEGKYLMCLRAEGYVTAYVPVDATKLQKREIVRMLPTVYMRKPKKQNELELDEVVVKATKLKFYMDGDTLVYDADAFPMAEGSMLGDLMKKLPGVEVDGGVIKVNGKKIDTMLLNGKDFFNKDRELLLENMPSYMVKSFNVHERAPESVKGTLQEKITEKEYIMDVRLKKEFSIGWIANAEAGGGATFFNNANGNKDGKYLGRLFGLRFTKNSRLTAFVNANNLNDYRNPGENGDWAQLSQSEGQISRVKVGMNYRLDQDWSLPHSYHYEGGIDGSYADYDYANHSSSVTFLDNGNTFGKSFYTKRSYNWELNTAHSLAYNQTKIGNLLQKLYITFTPYLYFSKWDNATASANATFAEDVASQLGKEWMDSISAPNAGELLKRYAINRTMSSTKGIGHSMNTGGSAYISVNPAYNDRLRLVLDISGNATDNCEDTYEHFRLDYPRDITQNTDYRNRFSPAKNKTQNFNVTPTMDIILDNEVRHAFSLRYAYRYNHYDNNNPLYLLNKLKDWEQPNSHPLGMLPSEEEVLTTFDKNNSSHSVGTQHTFSPEIIYQYRNEDEEKEVSHRIRRTLQVLFTTNFGNEEEHYRQGAQIDTVMVRNTTLLNGYIYYDAKSKQNTKEISAYYGFNVTAPHMTSLLNTRNDRDPLNIILGNPYLKNTINHNIWGIYRNKFGKTLFNTNINVTFQNNAIAYGYIYNKETGVRTTKPQNVNGNWQAKADGSVDFPLDKDEKWRLNEFVYYEYYRSVDLIGTNATMDATRSIVGSHFIIDDLSLKYRPTHQMEFGIKGSMNYQNTSSKRENFETLNVFTYYYGANAQLELPLGIQLSTDLTMYSRRGYSEASMNTNELVWNARVAKKLMHGDLTLMFDGFDLLGNLSNVRRTINAQGSTETFYNVIPSYGLFHVIYRLNKQPKKKE